ncbi:flagellar basal body L-ring protein FlgH [Arvimicrobium flavum]|uniref:flagellar basal body L-ring protein FlgH n=1 Tax=Arvimicrobium flavum TaxID=3393320 RepID=UPI00237C2D9A|nr:flagellar basal body L-ring protein FlgH [Mesorhizobium shangrilense]
MIRRTLPLLFLAALYGCATPVNEIGRPPALSPVGSGIDDTTGSISQYPDAPSAAPGRFSLWNDRQSRLFTDPRALRPGDILTVEISIDDRARFKNESERNRSTSRDLGFGLGFEWEGAKTEGAGNINIDANTEASGAGTTERSERLELSVAAVVTQVFPNGNMMIQGSQEVRVNAELRILTIGGIVRPSDIGPNNTIPYERIAEARISYGGRGRLTEVQQPPYGTQILDNISPF